MIRTISGGDLGLDVLLGGGFRLVTRLPDRASATVLVRGGPGSGKTLVGLHVALELAKALGGDVAVGCVEILPSEYAAQIRSARSDIPEARVIALPASAPMASAEPRVFAGLLSDLDPAEPDLVASLETFERDVRGMGGKPVVFVVDSLIEGYGIGASASRTSVDAVMKFAAQGGYGLVLCEETLTAAPSSWVFAADTVLELGVEPLERGRWIEVRKHRFGASTSGRHEIDLRGPEVFPEPHAWVALDLRDVLGAHGWSFREGTGTPALMLHPGLHTNATMRPFEGAFAFVTSSNMGVARTLAYGLLPVGTTSERDLLFEFDPLVLVTEGQFGAPGDNYYVPTVHGAARGLRDLVEGFAYEMNDPTSMVPRVQRVVLGDLDLVLPAPDALAWVEAVRVFTSLVVATGWGIPVIAYAGGLGEENGAAARSTLWRHADVAIAVRGDEGIAVERWTRAPFRFQFSKLIAEVALPAELAGLDHLLRPRDRRTDPKKRS